VITLHDDIYTITRTISGINLPHPPPVQEEVTYLLNPHACGFNKFMALFPLRERGVGDREKVFMIEVK
jgi:hypothetical protein